MQILLTFTGFHDPYSSSVVANARQMGPILSILHNSRFDIVYLFDTPGAHEHTVETVQAIETQLPKTKVDVKELSKLKDPTDHRLILTYLRDFLTEIVNAHPDAHFTIALSSGTPSMHACWLLVVAEGTINARLIKGHPPKHIGEKYQISEVDLSSEEFPHIERREQMKPERYYAETPNLNSVCEEIGIVGSNKDFVEALQTVAKVARYDAHILLLGETGTGKELFAKLIHRLSNRADSQFVVMNCAATPKDLVESILFGHKKGAFTGASSDQVGEFDNADGGTLFLDEIGELPMPSQSKLLRVLQDGIIKPLGAGKEHKVNVRVVAATNADITKAIESDKFRLDLSNRFAARITIPPLRHRRDDIAKLTTFTLDQWNRLYGEKRSISRSALKRLQEYHWPGNVRELVATIQTSAMISGKKVLGEQDLEFDESPYWANDGIPQPEPHEGFSLRDYLDEQRTTLISRALEIANGNNSQAARLLGVTPQAIHRYLKNEEEYGLNQS